MDTVLTALQLLIPLSFVTLVVGVVSARAGGGTTDVHDLMDVAFLGGGPGRVAETAVVAMHADGRLGIGGPGIVALYSDVARNPVERSVVEEHHRAPHGALHALRLAVMRGRAVQDIGDSLAARGLLVPARKTRVWAVWGLTQAIVCLVTVPLTIVRLAGTGSLALIPTLPLAVIGIVSGFICAALARRRLTAAGVRARLKFRRATYQHIMAPDLQIALDGHMALDDPLLREQLTAARGMRPGRDFQPAPHLAATTVVWCASADFGDGGSGGSGCGGSGGSGCGSSGGGCGGGGGSGDGGGGGGGGGCGGGGGGCGGGGGGG
ncbi:TIGR04222 domain-containing membrane protein [Streptomyces niveus]|uniref:TIGR04222 domain-containing membrane protein n=1 Tax=Streptomyces niveus TaxID=193462 RepID=UPI0036818310